MAFSCELCGKRPSTGNTVSHANNKSRRRFLPNLKSRARERLRSGAEAARLHAVHPLGESHQGRLSGTCRNPREHAHRSVLRLLGYARPYAWLVAIVIVFSLLYGGGLTGRAFILKGLVDDVALENARVELDRGPAQAPVDRGAQSRASSARSGAS